MFKHSTVFFIIAIIAVLHLFSGFAIGGMAVSVVPGWHTTIFPPYTIAIFVQLFWICLLPIFYWFIQRKGIYLTPWIVPVHLACTLCYFISAGTILMIFTTESSLFWITASNVVFVLGQFVFLVSLLTSRKQSNQKTDKPISS